MQPQNYTPIDDFIQKHFAAVSRPPEAEPARNREPIAVSEIKEVKKEIGAYIEHTQEHVELPEELKKIGVENTAPVDFSGSELKLPIPDEKIAIGMHAPITSSLRWLAMWATYLLHQAHLTLKVVHGKAIRMRA